MDNRLDYRLHRVNKHPTGCTTDWMFVYTIPPVVSYFHTRQSNLYLSPTDASKAFDRINNQKLVDNLVQRHLPKCFVSKAYSIVFMCATGWCLEFTLRGQMRASSWHICHMLCSIFMLIIVLLNFGIMTLAVTYPMCFGCIMYADDLILLSPSVVGLQCKLTLDVCTDYCHTFDIVLMLASAQQQL